MHANHILDDSLSRPAPHRAVVRVIFDGAKPYLVDGEWRSIVEANDWLLSLQRSGRAPTTWRAYAYGLADWLGWCARRDITWQFASPTDMALYVNGLARDPNGVNHRITNLSLFYRWRQDTYGDVRLPFEMRKTTIVMPGRDRGKIVEAPTIRRRIYQSDEIIIPTSVQAKAFKDAMQTGRNALVVDIIMGAKRSLSNPSTPC